MNLEDASEAVLLESDAVEEPQDMSGENETPQSPEQDESPTAIAAGQEEEVEGAYQEDQADSAEDSEPTAEETEAADEE